MAGILTDLRRRSIPRSISRLLPIASEFGADFGLLLLLASLLCLRFGQYVTRTKIDLGFKGKGRLGKQAFLPCNIRLLNLLLSVLRGRTLPRQCSYVRHKSHVKRMVFLFMDCSSFRGFSSVMIARFYSIKAVLWAWQSVCLGLVVSLVRSEFAHFMATLLLFSFQIEFGLFNPQLGAHF